MADDQSQRPFRASEPPVRGPSRAPGGSDPLAELARLIGQTDPFGEFARRTSASQSVERGNWNTQPVVSPYAPRFSGNRSGVAAPQDLADDGYIERPVSTEQSAARTQSYIDRDYGRKSFDDWPAAGAGDSYPPEQEAHGYLPGQADYQNEGYEHDTAQPADEYYDDAPPPRRRLGVTAIAAVFALAVVGTAGAFGYRALFGSSGSGQPPPVIKADAGPSKITPATASKDSQSGKLINDRVNDKGQSEKLVSREEQPIDKPGAAVLMQSAPQSPLGSGVISNEPKKIRTIAIHPDQPVIADPQPPAPPLAAAAPARAAAAPAPPPPAPAPPPPVKPAAPAAAADPEPAPAPPPVTRPAPQARQAAPAPSSSAPLSLNPDASARAAARPAAAPPAPTRTAAIAAPATASTGTAGGSGSFVQVSSQRSEAEAQTAFKSLQAKFPNQLGGRQPLIHRVDLGAKGIYYRTMVGPFANAGEAGELCSSLKAAGGQCLIQRN